MKKNSINIFAAIGLISTIAAVIYVAYFGFSSIKNSNLGSDLLAALNRTSVSPTEQAIVFNTAYELVNHDEPFTLEWSHEGKKSEGSYSFFYECRDGISFNTVSNDDKRTAINCGVYSPVSVSDSDTVSETNIRMIASSTIRQFADVPISIIFSSDDGSPEEIRGGTIITIINNDLILTAQNTEVLPASPAAPIVNRGVETGQLIQFGGENSTSATPVGINPSGQSDLEARFLEVGYVDVATNEFFATSTIPRGKRAAVRFDIVNSGNNISGPWTFNAVLPTSPHYIFQSQTQTSLKPSERIEFTLGFDRIVSDATGTVIVNVDPTRSISESDEENNILKIELSIEPLN